MVTMTRGHQIVVLLLTLPWPSLTFNLDPRIPVIKTGGHFSDSFFGYSVAQHWTTRQAKILVGAPQDQNLQPGTNRSGAVYQCDISNRVDDCVQIATDGLRSLDRSSSKYGIYNGSLSSSLNPPVNYEIKDGQWLGVQIQSQGAGGKVIACAHRYTVRDVDRTSFRISDTRRALLGLCYILEPDLSLPDNADIGYKNVMVVRDAVGTKQLLPKPNFDDHEEWGVCQLGMTTSFVEREDQEDREDLALFGAPGCFTWRGNVFVQDVGSVKRYEVAINRKDNQQFSKHGHMGFSVTSGRFFDDQMYYVSGAPHAGLEESRTGEIYFFQKHKAGSRRNEELDLNPDLIIRGEEFGAGFGYTLESLDVNGDSFPDLLVGAPFLDGDKTERGGAVYLYLSKNGALNDETSIKIIGKQLESQFGIAISTVGDLNIDGYDDFAVGAPYEDGGGAVYIFFGGPRGLRTYGPSPNFINAEDAADQIMRGEDLVKLVPSLPSSLATFGSSLSGGMDLDENGYPDLLVGAFQSNKVFLIRARPIIDITTFVEESKLKGIDPGNSGCPEDPDVKESCFSFRACFSIDNEKVRGLDLEYTLEAEPTKPVSRIGIKLLEEPTSAQRSVISDTIHLNQARNGKREERCTDFVGYVNTYSDLQSPVQFALSYSLVQEAPVMQYQSRSAGLPDINDYPILNQAQAKKRFQATFEKDCGLDDICQSQLTLEPKLKDKNLIELGKTPGGFYELELGSLEGSELVLDVEVVNQGDPAYEARMDVFFPEDVTYIGLGEAEINAPEVKNATWLQISLGNPFKGIDNETNQANSIHIPLRFSPRNNIKEKLLLFYMSANTSSEQAFDPSTMINLVVVRRAELKIEGKGFPEQIHYGGRVRGESDFVELGELGPQIIHKFLVFNGGPSDVDMVTVHIDWPFQVENDEAQGKWLLYLTEHPLLKNGRGDCAIMNGHKANPLNLTADYVDGITARHASTPQNVVMLPDDLKHRQRREVEKVIRPQTVKVGDQSLRVVTLDCDRGTAKCLRITCQIFNLPAKVSASIEVRARVWNSTLEEDYSFASAEVDLIEIFSKAKIKINNVVTQDISDDYVSVRTKAFPDARQMSPDTRVDWWVILVGVLVGLLLLVLISLVLWKLGFFKRKRSPVRADEYDDEDFMMSAHFEKVKLNGAG